VSSPTFEKFCKQRQAVAAEVVDAYGRERHSEVVIQEQKAKSNNGGDFTTLFEMANSELLKIAIWFKANKLAAKDKKTKDISSIQNKKSELTTFVFTIKTMT